MSRLKQGIVYGCAFAGTVYAVAWGAATVRWLGFAVASGDWLNDWLCGLPGFVRAAVIALR